ncbi:MAG: hypothetical protein MUQ30_20270 [Anaerolineae bacterium]|nr:hypothetical protein [Anaerolineae bacterium]
MDDLVLWLLEYGGPAIRYRTAMELFSGPTDLDVARLSADLLASPMTQPWLDRVGVPGNGFFGFHHSRPEAFENAASKLCDLGLRVGMVLLDEKMLPYRRWLEGQAEAINDIAEGSHSDVVTREVTQAALDSGIRWFEAVLVAARLAWLGYPDAAVGICLTRRLETLHALARTGDHDIYIDQDTFGDYPNDPFRKRRFVDPQFNGILPSIHDLYALAHFPSALLDAAAQHKIDTVAAYVLHPDYQALEDGYGVMRAAPRRYFSMGWSIHLPGYDGFDFDNGQAGMLVQRLELMAHFPVARRSQWFRRTLDHLESCRTETGTYRFPASYLREQAGGYWVTGAYMRLEVNRRNRLSLEIESTFRMCKIKRLMADQGV